MSKSRRAQFGQQPITPQLARERAARTTVTLAPLTLLIGAMCLAFNCIAADKPIYQCDERAFTDVGCQANRTGERVLSGASISLYAAPNIEASENRQTAKTRRPSRSRDASTDQCASIRTALTQLKTRRRRGYSSDTEAQLDAREASLRRQLRELCLRQRVRASGSR